MPATAKTTDLNETMIEILSGCKIDGQSLAIGQELDRKTYLAFNKILESIGGKWNKTRKAHIFPDGVDVPKMVVDIGLSRCFVDPRVNGFFPTPDELADRVVDLADIAKPMMCLEPSAGTGQLAGRMREKGGTVMCCELLLDNYRSLVNSGFHVVSRDFIDYAKIQISGNLTPFDRVVMNPPFSKQQDIAHVALAWQLVKDGGVLVAIVSSGAVHGEGKKNMEFRKLVDEWGHAEDLPDNSFAEVGTNVRTCLVRLQKTT